MSIRGPTPKIEEGGPKNSRPSVQNFYGTAVGAVTDRFYLITSCIVYMYELLCFWNVSENIRHSAVIYSYVRLPYVLTVPG